MIAQGTTWRLVVHVSYEVKALDCIHDVKGVVVMHEKINREAEEHQNTPYDDPTLIINRTIMRICVRRSLRRDCTGLWISLNAHEVVVR